MDYTVLENTEISTLPVAYFPIVKKFHRIGES